MPDASTISWILGSIGMGSAAIWLVAEIKGTTRELRKSIDRLSDTIEKVETRQLDHEVRLVLLERGVKT
jgi:hypothetical protein